MKTVTMHEAKTHLSRLVAEALAGEEIVIARRKQPLVRLSVIREERSKRRVGALPDLVDTMGDGFNEPMEEWSADLVPSSGRRAGAGRKVRKK